MIRMRMKNEPKKPIANGEKGTRMWWRKVMQETEKIEQKRTNKKTTATVTVTAQHLNFEIGIWRSVCKMKRSEFRVLLCYIL